MMQYEYTNSYFDVPYTITGFIRYVRARSEHERRGKCPALSSIPNQAERLLTEREYGTMELEQKPPLAIRAVPLITCACVIYQSTESTMIHIHHAPSGTIYEEDIHRALTSLGTTNARSLYVIFAHSTPHDNEYQASLDLLVESGIPEDNILEITNGPSTFGVNSLGQIGA